MSSTSRSKEDVPQSPRLSFVSSLPNTYRVEEEITYGGFATISLAHHSKSLRQVAIKEITVRVIPPLCYDPDKPIIVENRLMLPILPTLLWNIKDEYNMLKAGQQSPFIVRLFDAFLILTRRKMLIVTELCAGDVRQIIKICFYQDQAGKAGLPLRSVILLAAPIFKALKFLHSQGIIHRDIKLDNFLIDMFGVPKLADFGGAIRIGKSKDYIGRHRFGTPVYQAPETVNRKAYSRATDMWSMALCLLELWTGTFEEKDRLAWQLELKGFRGMKSSVAEEKLIDLLCFNKQKLTSLRIISKKFWIANREFFSKFFFYGPENRLSAAHICQLPDFASALQSWENFLEFKRFPSAQVTQDFFNYALFNVEAGKYGYHLMKEAGLTPEGRANIL